MESVKVRIDEIVIGDRVRKDMGDLAGLAASINWLGLFAPPIILPDRRLVAGERRIVAARDILLWEEIECRIFPDLDSALKQAAAEDHENRERKPLNVEESVEMGRRLKALMKPEAAARQAETRFGAGGAEGAEDDGAESDTTENTSNKPEETRRKTGGPKGKKTRDKVAAALGMSHTTLTKATEVVDAAKDNPELRPIVDRLNVDGNVSAAHRAVEAATKPPVDPIEASRKKALADLATFDRSAFAHSELGGAVDLQMLQRGTKLCREAFDATPAPASPPVLEFPCAGKVKTWALTQEQVDEWRADFPHLDVVGECRKALVWAKANATKRKTAKGMTRFLASWLTRAQDSGRGGSGPAARQAPDKMAGLLAGIRSEETEIEPGTYLSQTEEPRGRIPF